MLYEPCCSGCSVPKVSCSLFAELPVEIFGLTFDTINIHYIIMIIIIIIIIIIYIIFILTLILYLWNWPGPTTLETETDYMCGRASSSRVHKWKCFLGHGCPGGRSLDIVERKQDRSKTMSSTVADFPHSTQEAQAQEVGCGLHKGTSGRRFDNVLATKASIHGLSSRDCLLYTSPSPRD